MRRVPLSLRLAMAALVVLLAVSPAPSLAQSALRPVSPAPALATTAPEKPFNYYPLVVGLGAVAGVVGFNVLALGVEALPGGLAYGAGAVVPAEASVAMSRVYAVTSAVAGGLIAYYLYAP